MAVSQKPSPLWNVPYGRNKFFTGRDDALHLLYQELQIRDAVALSQPQAITGLGGIGKTQMALEYAYRYGSKYAAVLWVRAASASELISSFVELARALNLPERNEQDQNIIVEAVQRWLRLHTGWLLIFDNMDDPRIAESFLPKAGPGHLLFTTREQALGNLAQCVEVQQMRPEIGALLLLRKAEIIPLQATLEQADRDDHTVADEISRTLDGLPLALDQAGAYVRATSCSLRDYLTLYQTRRQNLLQERGSFNRDYPASVATTWSLSFGKVRQALPAAAELLNFCAFLAPDAIPQTIITEGAPHLGDVLAPVVTDPVQFDLLCKEVLKYSLIQREGDAGTLTIHRLVQAVLQDNLPSETRVDWKQRAVLAVSTASPNAENVGQWDVCEQLVPHALVCATWIEQERINRKESAFLLNQAGYYLSTRGRYPEAEPLYGRALAINEELLGDHPDTALSLDNLAVLYREQGKYTEAEPLSRRALTINEQQLERGHPDTARSLNNLAELYKAQGRYAEAEPLCRRALAINEQQLGRDHPYTATSLNNLATLCHTQGKYTEAERLYQYAFLIRKQLLGEFHFNTASSLNNLAELYRAQGKFVEAEPLYRQALSICEKQLGEDHPRTATSLNNLAELYKEQGRYAEAESLYRQALSICEEQLGDHSDTAGSLSNLAGLYKDQRKFEEAEPLYRRALTICEKQLGENHLYTAVCLNNLATLYLIQKKYAEAESSFRQVLLIHEKQLGENHLDTATILSNLVGLYREQERYGEAEQLCRRALAIHEEQLGRDHLDTATSLHSLALLCQVQRKYAEAEPLYRRALSIREQKLGGDHPHTLRTLDNLAILYYMQGRHSEAKQLFQLALTISEQVLGPDHSDTQNTRKWYFSLLEKMKQKKNLQGLRSKYTPHRKKR